MNVAFFNSIATWGGGEKWHFETSVYFAQKGYNIFFFCNPDGVIAEKLKQFPQVKIIPIKASNLSFLNPFKIKAVKQQFIDNKIDTVIINHPGDLKIAGNAAHKAGVSRIIYRRGSAIPIKDKALNRYIFKNWITDILANSEATKLTIVEKNAQLFPLEDIKVIYNHIDIAKFSSIETKRDDQFDEDTLVIGNLGRLAPQKNQHFLIDLSKQLTELNIKHKILIGGIGELEEELKAYSNAQGTQDTVLFEGFQEDIQAFLSRIDIFFLSSLWEGFGYVLAEAALCKKPIIAFNLSSNPELVIDNQSGYLIDKNSIEQAVEKILLLKDKDLRQKFGEYGYNHCSKTFERNHILNQLEQYIFLK
ncbi:glycosyltransferase [Myroides marinus]|uniref:glycosyltransferase n=1 Tax=Myroides marinus TaxID=703342 RepID=UPI0025771B16|nr:glycosyltransferase [Myroides marinus]MDM1347007.1 glycosyltransferase [Myroides marinus]MDM1351582.1 glycosyltransferase [Myroides marinus]MDM1358776.1 glycosyltransferase [Myroides marinus]MDM1362670.1 glycosyltransferase [Myroides marinus]MDM1365899.1 glycosyltransferase [Myroides marinus]